jgi:hypothetical protein
MYNYHLPITEGLLVKGSTFFEFIINHLAKDALPSEFSYLSANIKAYCSEYFNRFLVYYSEYCNGLACFIVNIIINLHSAIYLPTLKPIVVNTLTGFWSIIVNTVTGSHAL